MKDLTQQTSEELYAILKAGTKLYTAEEVEAAQNELDYRQTQAKFEVQSNELAGGSLENEEKSAGDIKPAWGLLVMAVVLFIFGTMSADLQYQLATTGMSSESAPVINMIFICIYVVAIAVLIAHVIGRDLSYKALWIIGGILLTKWVLIGLWLYSMANPKKAEAPKPAIAETYKRYKD